MASGPRTRSLLVRPATAVLAITLAVLALACGGEPPPPTADAAAAAEQLIPRVGGGLVVALRSEPKGFNPILAADGNTAAVTRRMHSDLIHIDRFTQETGPSLAESWEVSDDGRRFTLTLRPDLRFSDGTPLGVEDVLFTYRVYLDEEVGSTHRELLMVGGEPIAVRAVDERRVEFELAAPYAVGDRLFDSIPILPRHKLEAAYQAGEIQAAWGLDADPADIVGLGPFRLREYVPGERVVLDRNPNYWRGDEAGTPLPYLDTLTFLIVPSRDTQVLRFQSGELHMINRLSAENFELLANGPGAERYRLENLGPDLNFTFLFFNRNDLSADSPVTRQQRWFDEPDFRRAVSAAIDRRAIVDLVFRGRATALASHASPGLKHWFDETLAPTERSVEKARELLSGGGFSWDADGKLMGPRGEPVRWTVITNSSNAQRVQILTILQEDLAEIGIEMQTVPLDFGALLDRVFQSFDYSAVVLGLGGGDADPNSQMGYLVSSGGQHLWRRAGDSGSQPWQDEIDRLMKTQLVALDVAERRRLYSRVQSLVAENLPFIPLVSSHLLVGAQREVGNFRPAILDHQTLWNADELFLAAPSE